MRVVYEAENLFDAHLVRGRLGSEGIPAHVRGEFLAGAMGELPMSGLMAVCVADEDVEQALALLAQWREEPVDVEPELDAGDDADAATGPENGAIRV